MRIVVLAGGASDEREVSLRSGAAVSNALRESGHEVVELDPADSVDTLLRQIQAVDVVFPALHGKGGEDGELQAYLEQYNIPFVGSGSEASRLCFDKFSYTQLLQERGYLVPSTALVTHEEFAQSPLSKRPYVLKPNDGGSSIDTFIVRKIKEANLDAIRHAFEKHGKLLLQELIEGRELTVAVLLEQSLAPIEIIPPTGEEFDYENKYNGTTRELCPAPNLSTTLKTKLQHLAQDIHNLTGCLHMSRTDVILTPHEEFYVLETNTIPGLTDQSLLPKAAAEAGHTMAAVCHLLVEQATS